MANKDGNATMLVCKEASREKLRFIDSLILQTSLGISIEWMGSDASAISAMSTSIRGNIKSFVI